MFYEEDEDGNLLDDISETEELDKKIISIVRANRFLYNKIKNFTVKHRFAQLRQRFVKERKKVIQSQVSANYFHFVLNSVEMYTVIFLILLFQYII
ncbi:hypothetical protein PUN28_019394 [Cardiocondyla obscurior]|uniref:Uncharacterized protein n=1 Tax=Cardiocondyla obscurior TaxID=286306 RepID=A0AAW2EE21_9HYME